MLNRNIKGHDAFPAHQRLSVWLKRSGQDEAVQASSDLFSFKAVVEHGELAIAGTFTKDEAMAICHIFGPEIADPLFPGKLNELPHLLSRYIQEQEEMAKVAQIFRIDSILLSKKMSGLHPVEALAVLDLVMRYMANRRSSWDEETAIRLFHCLEDSDTHDAKGMANQ